VLTWFLDGYHRDKFPNLTHDVVKNMIKELGIKPISERTSDMANIARKIFPVTSCSKNMMERYAGDLYEMDLMVRRTVMGFFRAGPYMANVDRGPGNGCVT
jgi:hypothetical protein